MRRNRGETPWNGGRKLRLVDEDHEKLDDSTAEVLATCPLLGDVQPSQIRSQYLQRKHTHQWTDKKEDNHDMLNLMVEERIPDERASMDDKTITWLTGWSPQRLRDVEPINRGEEGEGHANMQMVGSWIGVRRASEGESREGMSNSANVRENSSTTPRVTSDPGRRRRDLSLVNSPILHPPNGTNRLNQGFRSRHGGRIRSDEEMVLGNWFEGLHTQYPWPWPEIKVWSYGRKAIKLGRQDIDSKNRID
ncbi:hypothetical protein EDC04DRAFT_2600772 [Pisolithus marmoratus]|nr:hypothetical protein EDC04DRAFT_2600772 [Pisolithus marmoratus]